MSGAGWTSLPLTHPTPFSLILLNLSPREVLACRAVCSSWSSWFSASSSLWSKYLSLQLSQDQSDPGQVLVSYRRRKILESRSESEADCLRVSVMLWRARREVCPSVSTHTMGLVKRLEEKVPVLGPPALFIRLKVDHPVVKKIVVELLNKYLSCICLNKQDVARNEEIKNFVTRQSWGPNGTQSWAFVDNLRSKEMEEEAEEDKEGEGMEGVVLEGEHRLEEALRLSLEPRGEKRKMEEESSDVSSDVKKRKLEEDEENEEEEAEENEETSIYAVDNVGSGDMFPSILDVLSIDHEVVRDLLVDRCAIHKHFIVPEFDKIFQHISRFQDKEKITRVVSCDTDGKVVSIDPAMFGNVGDTLVGYVDSPFSIGDHEHLVTNWGGRDIRDKWPEFAQQLSQTSGLTLKSTKKTSRQVQSEPSSSAAKSESDLLASLAARGISILRK